MLAYRNVPPCGRGSTNPAGSGAHGAAERLCSFRPLPPPPLLWHRVSTTLRRQPAAGAGAGVGAQAEAGGIPASGCRVKGALNTL